MKNTQYGQTDGRGRIINPETGRPLRQREGRTGPGKPFHGQDGKPNRKATRRLKARQANWAEVTKRGTRHDWHEPGSLK